MTYENASDDPKNRDPNLTHGFSAIFETGCKWDKLEQTAANWNKLEIVSNY